MNIYWEPKESNKIKRPNFPLRDKYLKPCCTWNSSTKEKVSRILDKNLDKISELKFSMKNNDNIFRLINYLSLEKITLNSVLIYRKIPIHTIDEIDESLPEDELYSPIKGPIPDCNDYFLTVKKIDAYKIKQTLLDLEKVNLFFGTNSASWGDMFLDEEDTPKKSSIKKGRKRAHSFSPLQEEEILKNIQNPLSLKYPKALTRFCNFLDEDSREKQTST